MRDSNHGEGGKYVFSSTEEPVRRRIITLMRGMPEGRLFVEYEGFPEFVAGKLLPDEGSEELLSLVTHTLGKMLRCGDLRYHKGKWTLHRRRWARRKKPPVRQKTVPVFVGSDQLDAHTEPSRRKKAKSGGKGVGPHRRPLPHAVQV